MYFIRLIINFLLFFCPAYSSAQNCNCKESYNYLKKKVEENYAGIGDTSILKTSYKNFNDSLEKLIANTDTLDYRCYLKLKSYMRYFKDPHLTVSFNTTGYKEPVAAIFKKLPLYYDSLAPRPKVNNRALKKMEGYWLDESNTFTMKVSAVSDDSLIGYITRGDGIYWHPGQVKLEVKKRKKDWLLKAYVRDHTVIIDSSTDISREIKVYSQMPLYRISERPDNQFSFRIINKKIAYFRLPDFLPQHRKKVLELLWQFDSVSKGVEHFIIDIRNNIGGSSTTYAPFTPYIYTDSAFFYGGVTRCTQDSRQSELNYSKDTNYSESNRAYFRSMADTMSKYMNGYWRSASKSYSFIYDTVYAIPRKVVILQNDRSFSAAELFSYYAKFSKKVTLMGKETYGAMNYLTVNSHLYIPCGQIQINYPIFRSDRADVMTTKGVAPHIELKIPERDWIEYAVAYLMRL
jgi:hypothetical protein